MNKCHFRLGYYWLSNSTEPMSSGLIDHPANIYSIWYIQCKTFEICKNSRVNVGILKNGSKVKFPMQNTIEHSLSLSPGFYPLLLSGSFRVIQSDLVAGFDEKSWVSRFLRVLTFALPLSRRGTMRYESLGSRIVTERSTLRTLDGNSYPSAAAEGSAAERTETTDGFFCWLESSHDPVYITPSDV